MTDGSEFQLKVLDSSDPESLLVAEYLAALKNYFTGGGRVHLERAIQFGREAAGSERGVFKLAAIHHKAMLSMLLQVLAREQPQSMEVEAVGRFCACCPA